MIPSGTRLGPYTILSQLGAGGRGEVYRAEDSTTLQHVAIKVLPERFAEDATARGRFKREINVLKALSHPNILRIFEFGHQDNIFYAVMELLEGETLSDRIKRAPIPWAKVVTIATGLAKGLAATHAAGVIHRDLKPDNIFLTEDGGIKLLDFGLARLEMASLPDEDSSPVKTGPGVMLGTVPYMSPEQVCGLSIDYRADIFAFGCVLYAMLTGHTIYSRKHLVATMSAILKDPPPSLDEFEVDVPPPLEALMQRMVEKDRERRCQTVDEVIEALQSL